MPILDGADAKAEELSNTDASLLHGYADDIQKAAIELQRETGLAIGDMLGFILADETEHTVGVSKADVVLPDLLSQMTGLERVGVETFLSRPVPSTHLRVISWTACGIACLRLDCVPPGQTEIEA